MSGSEWSRVEVEAIVEDYFEMLAAQLTHLPYNKTAHRRALRPKLSDRSDQSIEFKHMNISAVILDLGFPYITGYKRRSNYQALLAEVVTSRLAEDGRLLTAAAADADHLIVVPEVQDILAVLTDRPKSAAREGAVSDSAAGFVRLTTNYIEREARNRSLGTAGEAFVLNYERARLISAGMERLAANVEHTAKVRGDQEGYDVLSFEETGAERFIEVKTTKYGIDTPFYVTRNEVAVSEKHASRYQVYRLFSFRESPRLYTLPGAIGETCRLSAANFVAHPR